MKNFTLREWFFVIWLLACTIAIISLTLKINQLDPVATQIQNISDLFNENEKPNVRP